MSAVLDCVDTKQMPLGAIHVGASGSKRVGETCVLPMAKVVNQSGDFDAQLVLVRDTQAWLLLLNALHELACLVGHTHTVLKPSVRSVWKDQARVTELLATPQPLELRKPGTNVSGSQHSKSMIPGSGVCQSDRSLFGTT